MVTKYKVGDYIKYKASEYKTNPNDIFDLALMSENKYGEIILEVIPAMLQYVAKQYPYFANKFDTMYYVISSSDGKKNLVGESSIKSKIEKEIYLMEKLKAL